MPPPLDMWKILGEYCADHHVLPSADDVQTPDWTARLRYLLDDETIDKIIKTLGSYRYTREYLEDDWNAMYLCALSAQRQSGELRMEYDRAFIRLEMKYLRKRRVCERHLRRLEKVLNDGRTWAETFGEE